MMSTMFLPSFRHPVWFTVALLSFCAPWTVSAEAPLTPAQAVAAQLAPDLSSSQDIPLTEGVTQTFAIPEPENVSTVLDKKIPGLPVDLSVSTTSALPSEPMDAASEPPPAKLSNASLASMASSGDDNFLIAYEAFQKRRPDDIAAQLSSLTDHPLASYAELWSLLLSLSKEPTNADLIQQMDRFLHQHQGEYIAERARTDWARIASNNNDANRFYSLYRRLDWNQSEPDLVCSKARFDLEKALRTKKDLSNALTHAKRVIQETSRPNEKACGELRSAYLAADPKATWSIFLTLLQQKRFSTARELIKGTSQKTLPVNKKALDNMLAKPNQWHRQKVRRLDKEPAALLLAASLRLASADTPTAAKLAEIVSPRLSKTRRSLLWSRLGLEAALNLDDKALVYFQRAGSSLGAAPDTIGKNLILAWNARAALRARNWKKTLSAINQLPPALKKSDTWIYWRARSLDKLGRHREAHTLLTTLTKSPEFYGLLACDVLGKPYPVYSQKAPIPNMERWLDNPSIQRALHFYTLNLIMEGNREWNWALRKLKTSDRLELAAFAEQKGLPHREINTSETTPAVIFSQRYPRPHREAIEAAAQHADLAPSWVYGLIRQESRFVLRAKSSVGAQGMMQVMPKTAQWVAAHLALENVDANNLTDMDTNLTIGCQYLKLVVDSFEGSQVLATAAYNAGPSRAVAWRNRLSQPIEGALFTETIPFTETRNYVKRVLANTVHYSTYYNSNKNVMKLSAILGDIAPKPAQNEALP